MAIAHSISKHTNSSEEHVTQNKPIVKPYYSKLENYKLTILLSVIVMLTLIIAYLMLSHPAECQKLSYSLSDSGKIGKDNFRLVPRDEWLARPESEELTKHNLPVHRVIIAQTSTDDCKTQSVCSYRTKTIQEFHMDSNAFGDIGYNFLVGGDGAVYEGRGWDFQGAHTKGFNVDSICIAFIGTFIKSSPPEGQLNAAKLIIAEGVRLNKLVDDYKLYGARQFIGTESPGTVLFEIIKKWPHWSGKPV